jgi:hypothetical protein
MGVEIWRLEAARDAVRRLVRRHRTMGRTARWSVRRDRAIDRTSSGPLEGFGPGPKQAPEQRFGPPPEMSGPPPDGLASSPVWPNLGPNSTASEREFHRPSFAHKTPSPVHLTLYAYFSNISSHKA